MSLKLKARLAATVVAPRFSWGCLLSGRKPSQEDCRSLHAAFIKATRGPYLSTGRADPGLRQVLLLGHCSDLALEAASRTLRALARWKGLQNSRGRNPALQQGFIRTLSEVLRPWGWTAHSWRAAGPGRHSLRLAGDAASRAKRQHDLRTAWRLY